MRPWLTRTLLWAWSALLLGTLLWPLAAPGELLLRDMVVLDSPGLTASALGFGDLPARNAPQDGVLAVLGFLPVSWLVRLLLLGAGLAGAWGAMQLGPARFAAVTIALYNPLVIERLLQGHWSLVVTIWLLPLIVALRDRPRLQVLPLWLASLTPTGAVVAVVVAMLTSTRRWLTLCFGVLACLPWLVPALMSLVVGEGAQAFSVRAEAWVGTPGTILGLGGIWNAGAVPASREMGFAVFGVVLFAVLLAGYRNCPRPVLLLGACGVTATLLTWLLPSQFAWVVSTIPGTALFRDSQKLLMFAVPAYVCLAAGLYRKLLEVTAVALALLQVPDAARAVAVLTPVQLDHTEISELRELSAGRDILLPEASTLAMRNDGLPIVDPRTKALATVESGELRVDGSVTDPASQRWTDAMSAWESRDMKRLEELGVGVVVTENETIETGAGPQRDWTFNLGLGLTLLWMVLPVGLLMGSRGRKPGR